MIPKTTMALLVFIALCGCNESGTSDETSSPSPEISSFTTSASTITQSDSATLTSVFSNGSGRIDNSVGTVTSGASVNVSPSETTAYTLTVTNSAGDSVSASVDITVEPPPDDPPPDGPPPISVAIEEPDDGELVGTESLILATVVSEFDVSAVIAEVEDRSLSLEFSNDAICDLTLDRCRPGFSGRLSLVGLPPGPYVLTVRAEDLAGNAVSEQRSFVLDSKPVVTVTEPVDLSVARPDLPVEASCTDDVDDCVITAIGVSRNGRHEFASAENVLSEVIDLSAFDGQTITLELVGKDTAAQVSTIRRTIYVDSSTELTNEKMFSDSIIDFDGQRVLLKTTDSDGDGLTIVDIDSNNATVVGVHGGVEIFAAFLSPTGAIYEYKIVHDAYGAVQDWNNSLLSDVSSRSFVTSLRVAGDYAIWSDIDGLWRRQFSTMTNLQISDSAGTDRNAVGSNGVVAYWETPKSQTNYQIVKYDQGVFTTLTADVDHYNIWVETDGQGFVYLKRASSDAITFHDGTGETVLTSFREEEPRPGRDYMIVNGWIAFTELGGLGQTHVWTRDPSRALLQRTIFGSDSHIDGLAASGEVMLLNSGRRYLSEPTGELTDVSSALGQSTNINDTWYISMGRSLFQVR